MSKFFRCFILLASLFTCCYSAYAEQVSLETSENIISTAEYRKGDAEKPLLIFIHGFLQTSSFSTVERLADAMQDSDYPVLAPTLSLGISNRAQSLPCESIHLHSLQGDTDEIGQWVNWGLQQGHKEIVLIGHSAGSVNVTAYLADKPHPAVKKTILISLTYYGPDRPAAFETEADAITARQMVEQGDEGLGTFALAFCKQYVSPARYFLSYYDWSKDDILKAINIKSSQNYVIVGSNDERIKQEWRDELKEKSRKVIVVEGASHFFDKSHEFDLVDTVEEILSSE